jgi:hypothetical protein
MYRVELRLNQRDLIDFLDQNPGYKPLVEGIADASSSPEVTTLDPDSSSDFYRPAKTRKPRARRKRTVETLQAAAE